MFKCLAEEVYEIFANCEVTRVLAVNSYPETRHRYWNGYMLFYESSDKLKSQYGAAGDGSGLVRHDVGLRYGCSC